VWHQQLLLLLLVLLFARDHVRCWAAAAVVTVNRWRCLTGQDIRSLLTHRLTTCLAGGAVQQQQQAP
jgi:hypothetical protein